MVDEDQEAVSKQTVTPVELYVARSIWNQDWGDAWRMLGSLDHLSFGRETPINNKALKTSTSRAINTTALPIFIVYTLAAVSMCLSRPLAFK